MIREKPLILCLEDLDNWQARLGKILESDYRLTFAKSIEEARQAVDDETPDLALVDINLASDNVNNEGGFVFAESLKRAGILGELPIVIVSAYGTPERIVSAFKDLHVVDFFFKGDLDPTKLRESIADNLPQRHVAPARVLVVEDNPGWQARLKKLLEVDGYLVDVASDYLDASRKLMTGAYQLAIIDIRLDDLNPEDERGKDLYKTKHLFGKEEVDCIVVSAYGTGEQVAEAFRDFGVQDYMFKGTFDPEVFRSRVRRLLDSQFYAVVEVEQGDQKRDHLARDQEALLKVSTRRSKPLNRPAIGDFRSLSRPKTEQDWEIEVTVISTDMKVLPGSRQSILVRSDYTSDPLFFRLLPITSGTVKLELEFYQRDTFAKRLAFEIQVVDRL